MANQLLFHAVAQGDPDQVQTVVVECCADVNGLNTLGETPCHYAAMKGHATVLEVLLAYGADPNVQMKKDYGGATPLLLAAKLQHVPTVEILLRHHADPNLPDAQGFTPLHISARDGHVELSKMFIAWGANVEAPDNMGKPPFFWAKENHHVAVMELLPVFKYDWHSNLNKLKNEIQWIDRNEEEAAKPKPSGKKKGKKGK
eukprot:NODE_1658_length_779_cov_84.312883_g1609_i0.p1 GENE.NODE_1658_length_779_cov_84.312883_g1609_i0~~NODE_1658_length_779_cov_84.312883_g1609_i0.p1  ORF type:complete len:201 (+),score=26.91 NODE_1658_length_779_cov_84.312883_g1609_i0:149-751(+)